MKNPGIRIVVLLVLQALWLETSHSGEPGSSRFGEERSKQEASIVAQETEPLGLYRRQI